MDKQNVETTDVWPPAPTNQPVPNRISPASVTGQQVTTAKHLREGRLVSAFIFGLGLVFAFWEKADYASAGGVSEKAIIVIPAVLLASLASMIEPRILLASAKGAPPQPAIFKVLGYTIAFIGFGIGFYIRYTFFK